MSLVAYGASDDSGTSDVDDAEVSQTANDASCDDRAAADDGKISDEDDYVPTSSLQTQSQSATSTTKSAAPFLRQPGVSAPTSLSDLPAPKAADNTAAPAAEGEDELEDEVKPKPSQLADAPKPPPKSKSKQPTRIVIPALKSSQDSDEEDDSNKKPKPAAAKSGSGSGLFSLLPPPMHGVRKQTNRPLIPHTLTKRPAAPTKPTSKPASSTTALSADSDLLPSTKHKSAFNALTGYESDSDEEDGENFSFFSIKGGGEEAKPSTSSLTNSALSVSDRGDSDTLKLEESAESEAQTSNRTPSAVNSDSAVSSSKVSSSASADSDVAVPGTSGEQPASDDDEENSNSNDDEVSSTMGVPQGDQDAPLSFSSGLQSRGWTAAPLISPMMPAEMYGHTDYWQQQQHYAQDYAPDMQQEMESMESEPGSSSGGIQQYMEDEQFLRISGKRKRAHEENVQIIDASVDDYVDSNDLMKGISEESSYQPHRKKDNMPSSQQRRKKQITYLAFQAKERELELKNQWSQNRMNKNQARSKYGF